MTTENTIQLLSPTSLEEFDAVKILFREHEKELAEDVCFQNFGVEMKNIQTIYSLPAGALVLATHQGEAVGVVAMVCNDSGVCEMKRLYVRPNWRKKGIGKILCKKIMNVAKKASYSSMRLETLSRLDAAIALYLDLGFKIHEEPKKTIDSDKNIYVMVSSL